MLKFLAAAWRRWLTFAEILGNIQMTILLTLIYWTMFLVIAIPFKIITNRRARKQQTTALWVSRTPDSNILDSMSKQG